jgi:hypothetical protein
VKTIIRALPLLMLLGAMVTCDSTPSNPAKPNLDQAVPPDNLRSCQVDQDCLKVATSCNGCCEQAAVNASSEAAYLSYKMDVCAAYMGGQCSCFTPPARVVCQAQKCTLEATDGGM